MKLSKLPGDAIVIKVEKQEKSDLGIVLPNDNIVHEVAEVLQVGDDVKHVKAGDRILFKTWAPNYYDINGEKFGVMKEEHWDGTL